MVADLEGRGVDGGPDGGDDAGGLVAQGQGLLDEDVAVAVVAEVVQVGAAEAGGLDGDEEVVGGEFGEGAFFLVRGRRKVKLLVQGHLRGVEQDSEHTTLRSLAPWRTDALTVCVAMLNKMLLLYYVYNRTMLCNAGRQSKQYK